MEQKKKYMLLGIIGTLILLIGVSYAYWRLVIYQTGENEVASSCFSITLTNEQNAINLQKAYPILDEEWKELTPYTFTVKNNCDAYASYSANLELLETILEEDRLSSGFIKVMLDENAPVLLTENTSIEPVWGLSSLVCKFLNIKFEGKLTVLKPALKGEKIGEKQSKIEIAKNLLETGMPIEKIEKL